MATDQSFDEFEPLFDYSRVQPKNLTFLDDDEFDDSPIAIPVKKKSKHDQAEKKENEKEGKDNTVILDDEDDWLLPPPTKVDNFRLDLEEDSTIKALRLKKQELASILAQSAEDIFNVTASTKSNINASENSDMELKGDLKSKKVDRKKILISIQDKDGQKQFRMYMDDRFEKLFKMYGEKVKLKAENLVFSFDGDKVSPTATPQGLGLDDDDMLEVNVKSD